MIKKIKSTEHIAHAAHLSKSSCVLDIDTDSRYWRTSHFRNVRLADTEKEMIWIPEKESDRGNFHYKQVVTHGKVLRMATNAQFPPYEYYESNKIVGIDAEIGKAIANKLGMVLKIEDMEFDSIKHLGVNPNLLI